MQYSYASQQMFVFLGLTVPFGNQTRVFLLSGQFPQIQMMFPIEMPIVLDAHCSHNKLCSLIPIHMPSKEIPLIDLQLVGGFKHFLSSISYTDVILPIDQYFSEGQAYHQPDRFMDDGFPIDGFIYIQSIRTDFQLMISTIMYFQLD